MAVVTEDKIDELLTVLDGDIQHIRDSLSRLNELRSLVIKQDDKALAQLLSRIRSDIKDYAWHERQRCSVRKDLADILGINVERVTLSMLEANLPQAKKTQVTDRKIKLRALTEQLKIEHLRTSLLLSDCARINRQLLNGILDLAQAATSTYGSDGAIKRQADPSFVSLQF